MIRREIGEADVLPRGYGVAWRVVDRRAVVCYPVPLNVIARLSYSFWRRLRVGRSTAWEQEETDIFVAGVQEGIRLADASHRRHTAEIEAKVEKLLRQWQLRN